MQGAFMLPEIVISEMQFLLQILHDFKNITVVFDKKELKNLYHWTKFYLYHQSTKQT